MTRVIVHVERLVLNGYRPDDRHAIAEALQAELVRLLSTEGGVARLTGLATVPPPRMVMPVDHGAKPGALGSAVARAIVGKGTR